MAKKIEKYRLILQADPGSMVFVELARALLDEGAFEEAIEVCKQGLDHHPESIVGHVLWGRALIGLGDPGAALDQFDQAVALDPDNPYAYNLIGEVLLKQQLYRSALPILRRAVSLQPGDARVRGWLDQAERATGGETQETEADPTLVRPALGAAPDGGDQPLPPVAPGAGFAFGDPPDAAPSPALDAAFDRVAAASTASDPEAPTQLAIAALPQAGDPAPGLDPAPGAPEVEAPIDGSAPPLSADPGADWAAAAAPGGAPLADPFAAAGGGADDEQVLPGMTATFDALGAAGSDLHAALSQAEAPEPGADPWDPDAPIPDLPAPPPAPPEHRGVQPGGPGPNDPTIMDGPPPVPPPMPKAGPADKTATELFGLELPPDPRAAPRRPEPKVVVAPAGEETAQVIAARYERELREKMMPGGAPPRTFLQRHGKWLAIGGAVVLALCTAGVALVYARRANRKDAVKSGLVAARNGIARDTDASYTAALGALGRVLDLDPHNAEAKALEAEADALLYADLDHDPKHRAAAEKLLKDPRLAAADPDAVLDARYHLAAGATRKQVGAEILAAQKKRPHSGLLDYLAGLTLLDQGKAPAATRRFQAALKHNEVLVRTLMAAGDYLAAQGQWDQALSGYFDRVREMVPDHVRAQLAAAEAKLELGRDLDGALGIVRLVGTEQKAHLVPDTRAKLAVLAGRLLEKKGEHEKAVARLEKAMAAQPHRPEIAATLARIHLAHFELPKALTAVDAAIARAPHDQKLHRLEGRVLLAWSRYRDAGSRLAAVDHPKEKTSLLRGMADYFAGSWSGARRALDATKTKDGKMPAEAAIYLALTDAGAGDPTRAQAVLAQAARVRRHDPLVWWALGRVALTNKDDRHGRRDLARALSYDGKDYRALADLGLAELARGRSDLALKDLGRAVAIDGYYAEGLVGLGQAHLARGEADPAADAFRKVLSDHPRDADAHRGLARALLAQGKLDDAEKHALAARRLDRSDGHNDQVLGDVLLAMGHTRGAVRALLRAQRLAPDDADVLADLAFAYLSRPSRGNAKRAEKYAKEALAQDRGHPRAEWAYGEALMILKDRKAIHTLQTAAYRLAHAGKTHDAAGAWRDVAQAWQTVPRKPVLSRAQSAAWRAVKTEDTAQNRELVAKILVAEGKPAVARAHLEKAVQLDPTRASARFALGQVLAQLKDAADAKAALEAYLKLAPRGHHAREAKKLLATLGS